MLTHPTDPSRVLVERSDLDPLALPAQLRRYEIHLRAIFDWGQGYLSSPHPELGRAGNVCPFAQPSLLQGRFFLAVQPGTPTEGPQLAATLRFYRNWFLDLAPRRLPAAKLTTILLLFPDAPHDEVSRVVDAVQNALKSEYVDEGLMLGEFHNGPPPKGGLWNAAFRPLRSPVPMLVVRHMVPTDYPFLRDDTEQTRAYLRLFGDQIPGPLREQVENDRLALELTEPCADQAGIGAP
ncbi:DUF6875 domain-containing protein [Amycolatopsis sp. H20-H5]|uniref:DUF6875 domain-containing protein n=1 Tax=Amycolatopsis sp. H20-H5 TaxID=3046309 RepID=UPI002DB9202F|nr:hypothetical protein [Amycolatopsis sp. H20-H5]MEC3974213.1 hypothetical protein [Amycolatopsis sp. H20-H5]